MQKIKKIELFFKFLSNCRKYKFILNLVKTIFQKSKSSKSKMLSHSRLFDRNGNINNEFYGTSLFTHASNYFVVHPDLYSEDYYKLASLEQLINIIKLNIEKRIIKFTDGLTDKHDENVIKSAVKFFKLIACYIEESLLTNYNGGFSTIPDVSNFQIQIEKLNKKIENLTKDNSPITTLSDEIRNKQKKIKEHQRCIKVCSTNIENNMPTIERHNKDINNKLYLKYKSMIYEQNKKTFDTLINDVNFKIKNREIYNQLNSSRTRYLEKVYNNITLIDDYNYRIKTIEESIIPVKLRLDKLIEEAEQENIISNTNDDTPPYTAEFKMPELENWDDEW